MIHVYVTELECPKSLCVLVDINENLLGNITVAQTIVFTTIETFLNQI